LVRKKTTKVRHKLVNAIKPILLMRNVSIIYLNNILEDEKPCR